MLHVIKVLEGKVGTKHSAHNVRHRLDESNYVEHSAELADALQLKDYLSIFQNCEVRGTREATASRLSTCRY